MKQAHRLQFSHNWNNKLLCDNFTTIRLHDPYRFKPGRVFEVVLKGVPMGKRVVLGIKTIRIDQVSDLIARLDTGYNAADFRKIIGNMYKNKVANVDAAYFDLVLLGKI